MRNDRSRTRVTISRLATSRTVWSPPRSSAPARRRPMASRNSSASVGGDRLEARDAPGGARGVQQRLLVRRRRRASRRRPRCARRSPRRRPSRPPRPAPRRARAPCAAPRARSSATVPLATRPPSLMIATASQRRSTSSSWWLENSTGTPASRARSTSTSLMTSTPTGSRPLNGSSRMSAIGSWTSAVASCTRCWLPSESCSTRSSARSRDAHLLHPVARRARRAAAASAPCSRAK